MSSPNEDGEAGGTLVARYGVLEQINTMDVIFQVDILFSDCISDTIRPFRLPYIS